jgi:hypothetical protein
MKCFPGAVPDKNIPLNSNPPKAAAILRLHSHFLRCLLVSSIFLPFFYHHTFYIKSINFSIAAAALKPPSTFASGGKGNSFRENRPPLTPLQKLFILISVHRVLTIFSPLYSNYNALKPPVCHSLPFLSLLQGESLSILLHW